MLGATMDNQSTTLSVTGKLIIVKTSEHGISETLEVPNLVVNAGKTFIASRMVSNSSLTMTHMAVGTNNTPAAAGDTALGAEVPSTGRVTLTSNIASSNTVTYVANFPAGSGTGALTEAGIFNAASAGTMLCRTVFPTVTKGSGDSVAITWIVSIT